MSTIIDFEGWSFGAVNIQMRDVYRIFGVNGDASVKGLRSRT
jgi:hypothetical protein